MQKKIRTFHLEKKISIKDSMNINFNVVSAMDKIDQWLSEVEG